MPVSALQVSLVPHPFTNSPGLYAFVQPVCLQSAAQNLTLMCQLVAIYITHFV